MNTGLAHFALAFALTQAIEIPVYVRIFGMRPRNAFLASALTHPVVWWWIPPFADRIFAWLSVRGMTLVHSTAFRVIAFAFLAEGFAVITEALYLRALSVRRPWLASLVANACSASLGYLCWLLTGWP